MLKMSDGDVRTALCAAADVKAQMAALELDPPAFGEDVTDQLAVLVGETAMLDVIAGSTDEDGAVSVLLRSPNLDAKKAIDQLAGAYRSLFAPALGFAATEKAGGVVLEMPGIARLMAVEQGTHLFTSGGVHLTVVQVIVGASDKPHPLDPVIRVSDDLAFTIDLRSGLAVRGGPTSGDVRKFLLSQLPLPPELEGGK